MTDQPRGPGATAPRFHYARVAEGGYRAMLGLVVATINAWNRLAIASRTPPGSYQPRKSAQHG